MFRLHNTLTKNVEEFVPRDPGKASLYVCGPTVYDSSHLGHMRAAIAFDVLRRYLEWKGFQVTHVQNFTDVDDRIIQRAQNEGTSTDAVTERYIAEYRQAYQALNLLPPHQEPRASRHIADMIEMIAKLMEQGYAYYAEGDVYFDVTKRPGYGKLSGRVLEDLRAGARVEPGEFKRHPADFALWKRAKAGEPSWESPWGRGRPGWHIECSAMSLKYLGMGFDVHGGGDDLIPHLGPADERGIELAEEIGIGVPRERDERGTLVAPAPNPVEQERRRPPELVFGAELDCGAPEVQVGVERNDVSGARAIRFPSDCAGDLRVLDQTRDDDVLAGLDVCTYADGELRVPPQTLLRTHAEPEA